MLGGVLSLVFSGGSYANGPDVLQLFATSRALAGDFTAVVSAGLAAGQVATFNAATGSISIVPEPFTFALAIMGAGIIRLTRTGGPATRRRG